MFTIYKVQTNLSDSPQATVVFEVGNEGLARALCEHMNNTSRDSGQTAFVWTQVSPQVRRNVDAAIKKLQQRDTAEEARLHILSEIHCFNNRRELGKAEEKTAYISLLVFRLKKLDGAAI